MEIKLEHMGNEIKVITPYNSDFVQKCRNLRGEFKQGAWWFRDNIIDYVRNAMLEIYGVTGEEQYEECSLLVKNFTRESTCAAVTLFGRTIARAFGRDSGAKLGDEIILIDGSIDSGGSMKNWSTCVKNATFEIQNFPLPATEKEEIQKAVAEGWCEIKLTLKHEDVEECEKFSNGGCDETNQPNEVQMQITESPKEIGKEQIKKNLEIVKLALRKIKSAQSDFVRMDYMLDENLLVKDIYDKIDEIENYLESSEKRLEYFEIKLQQATYNGGKLEI